MKKIVLTTTAVLSLLATGATISSVNASSSPTPQTNTQSDSIIATDVTLVEKREAKGKEKLTDVLSASNSKTNFVTVDWVDNAYRQEFSKQFASFESNYLARFNGKTIVFKATDYGIYTMKFELNGTLYKLTADVRENLGKGGPFYTYVTKLEVLSNNQANTISNTSTEKQIEATITKVEIDYFGLSFEGKISEPLQHGGDKAAKGNITLIDKNSGKVVYQSHNAVIFSGLTKDVSDQFLLPLIYSNQFKGDIFVSKQFPDGTYILEMSGEAGSPYDHLTDTRKRVFKVRKEVTIGNPSTNSNTNTTTQSGSNSNISGSWVQSGSRWWYKHADGSYTTNGWEKINGVWYRFDNSGWMQTGWVKDGSWYYLDGSGAMKTGWVKDNGSWYYLQDSGAMKTGWMKVSGKWYYAYSSGALAINTTTPDGYRVNYNGEWV